MMMNGVVSSMFILMEIACGIVVVVRFRGSPGALLGGIAFGIWAVTGILRPVLGAFDIGWWQYNLAFSLPSLAAYGCLLAALITGRVYNQTQGAADGRVAAQTGGPVAASGPAPTGASGPRPLKEVLFSFKGRISRSDYWLRGFLVLFPIGMFNNILMYGVRSPGARALAMIIGLACMWPSLALLSKRLHDRNRRALWLLTLLIPFADIVFAVWILIEVWFLKGTDGPNRFGEDPLRRSGPDPLQRGEPDPLQRAVEP
jgi:uncharacterized membrane protein YhaH (DUF805 family)